MTVNHVILERQEAADYIGVSATVLDRLTRRGYIAYVEWPSTGKAGRPTRKWTVADLDAFIASRRRIATPPPAAEAPKTPARAKRRGVQRTAPASATAILKAMEGGEA